MASKFVRSPNNDILVGAGIVLLLLSVSGIWTALASNPYSIPVLSRVVTGGGWNASLGTALLFVALRRSQFASATAVIVATFLFFAVVFAVVTGFVFGSPHVSWRMGVNVAIAAAILRPLLFPWSWSANKPALVWMGLTFGGMTLLLGSLAILARL